MVLKTFSVIPIIGCTSECSFLKLNIVHSKQRTTITQERLNSQFLIKIQQEMVLKLNPEDIINDFKKSANFKEECYCNIIYYHKL